MSKYETITTLYDEMCQSVVAGPEKWMDFLKTASRNYRLRFDEQLLVYAQRPDATALLTVEEWNRRYHRWIKKGSKGIAVFDDEVSQRQKLKYYFDVKDTLENQRAKPVTYWELSSQYENDVMDALDDFFGSVQPKDNFTHYIIKVTEKVVEENFDGYVDSLFPSLQHSSLEKEKEDVVIREFKSLLVNSIQFMIFDRLGFDTDLYFNNALFQEIEHFDTKYTLNALGFAASDIAKMELNEIARAVVKAKRLEKTQNENAKIKNEEGEIKDNENDLHDERQLSDSESEITGTNGENDGNLRGSIPSVSQTEEESSVLQSSDGLQIERTSDDGGERSKDERTEIDGRDNLEKESGSNELSEDGEVEEDGAGDDIDGYDEKLEEFDEKFLFPDIPVFDDWEKIKGMLKEATTEKIKNTTISKLELNDIQSYFKNHQLLDERVDYLRENINIELTGLLMGEKKAGYFYKKYVNGMIFIKGGYLNPKQQSFYNWNDIVKAFEEIIKDQYLSKENLENELENKPISQEEELEKFDFDKLVRHSECKNYLHNDRIKRIILVEAGVPFEFEGKSMQFLKEDLNKIKEFFDKNPEDDMRRIYIKDIFQPGENLMCVGENNERYGFKKYLDGVLFWKGNFETRESQAFLPWSSIVKYYEAIDLLGGLSNETKEKATQDETKEFYFTNEIIEKALHRGSGVCQGKMRIYFQFTKGASKTENADFLKREYGIGGCSSAIEGIDMHEHHDSKGIKLICGGYSDGSPSVLLKWSEVAAHIQMMIDSDQYLSKKEKEEYTNWLLAREVAKEQRIEVSDWQDEHEDSMKYVYQVGDVVFVDGGKYEILSFDNEKVCLYDFEFPLFNKEIPIDEFERQLEENIENEHLKQAAEDIGSSDLNDLISSAEMVSEGLNKVTVPKEHQTNEIEER